MSDSLKAIGFVIFPIILIMLVGIGFTSSSHLYQPDEGIKPIIKTQLILDCNRPEGHKVWKLDQVIFYKDFNITLKSGDVSEKVDASNWLCSIDSEVKK